MTTTKETSMNAVTYHRLTADYWGKTVKYEVRINGQRAFSVHKSSDATWSRSATWTARWFGLTGSASVAGQGETRDKATAQAIRKIQRIELYLAQVEFDEKWDHGTAAPTDWTDPRSDEWVQDSMRINELQEALR